MGLPTEKRQPQAGLGKILLYGRPKVGKSSAAVTMDPDHTLLLEVEPGGMALEVYPHEIRSWDRTREVDGKPVLRDDSFRGTIRMLVEDEHPFTTVVVDTVDVLAQLCGDDVLRALSGGNPARFVHAGDFEFGKGWNAWTDEFTLRIGALCRAVPNVVFVSHVDEGMKKDRLGEEFPVFTPALGPKGIRNWLMGFVDQILFLELGSDDERLLRTRPTRSYEAGGRTPEGAAKLPDPIVLPESQPGRALKQALEGLAAPVRPAKAAPKGKAKPAKSAPENGQGTLNAAA